MQIGQRWVQLTFSGWWIFVIVILLVIVIEIRRFGLPRVKRVESGRSITITITRAPGNRELHARSYSTPIGIDRKAFLG
jgi:hypothetical protein